MNENEFATGSVPVMVAARIYICLYTLVDRVMKCIEHCATAKAYGRFKEAGVMIKMDDVAAGIAKSKEEKDNVEKGLN